MDHDETLAKVIEIVNDTLELGDGVTLDETTDLKKLGADSFDLLELVTTLEDEFSVTFDDDAATSVATVGDVVAAIERARS
ncbi:phosphopantetheine-binding protein [Thermophilibacter sp.]